MKVSQLAEIPILFMIVGDHWIDKRFILLHSKVYIKKDIYWFTHWVFYNHSKFNFAILLNVNYDYIKVSSAKDQGWESQHPYTW